VRGEYPNNVQPVERLNDPATMAAKPSRSQISSPTDLSIVVVAGRFMRSSASSTFAAGNTVTC
jgi:hypothetical protein